MKIDEICVITESFNRPATWVKSFEKSWGNFIEQKYRFDVSNKQFIVRFGVMFDPQLDVSVDFERGDIEGEIWDKTALTNDVGGKDAIKVLATVMDIVKSNEYVQENGSFVFELKMSETSRVKLYQRMINRFGRSSTVIKNDGQYSILRVFI